MRREKLIITTLHECTWYGFVSIAKMNLRLEPIEISTWMIWVIGNATNVKIYLIANIN